MMQNEDPKGLRRFESNLANTQQTMDIMWLFESVKVLVGR